MNNPLYDLMMYNLVLTMKRRGKLYELKEGEYSIFQMTEVIGLATGQTCGQVMVDYLDKFHEVKTTYVVEGRTIAGNSNSED